MLKFPDISTSALVKDYTLAVFPTFLSSEFIEAVSSLYLSKNLYSQVYLLNICYAFHTSLRILVFLLISTEWFKQAFLPSISCSTEHE